MEVVGEASTGKEIVALAESMDYDLILMDIEMETMNAGITATEMIRDKNPQAKIIFLTAHELREIIITAMGAGALDYIVKGCSDEEILYHIRCALEGHPVMQGQIQQTVMQEYARLQKSEQSLLFFINNISRLTASEREIIRLLLDRRDPVRGEQYHQDTDQESAGKIWVQQDKGDRAGDPGIEYRTFILKCATHTQTFE